MGGIRMFSRRSPHRFLWKPQQFLTGCSWLRWGRRGKGRAVTGGILQRRRIRQTRLPGLAGRASQTPPSRAWQGFSEPVFPSLHDVALTTRVGLNNATLRWFRSHLVGGVFRTLLFAELLLEAITGPITLRQHAAARIANRVAGQRCTAAIRASTHALLLGWRRITIVQDDPHFFSNTSSDF